MSLEKLTAEINQQISLIQEAIAADKIPDFKPVHQKLDIFTEELRRYDAAIAKQYTGLLAVWGDEIRKSSESLQRRMSEIKDELSGIQNQNRAIRGYNYLKPE